MFTDKTVFVLGAGSSVECDLPSGKKLASDIAQDTQFYFEHGTRLTNGDSNLVQFCRNRFKVVGGEHFNQLTTPAWMIHKGLPLAPSIDHFIAAHIDNLEVVELGKAAIVSRILQAERSSILHFDFDRVQSFWRNSDISSTWLISFFHKLVEGINREDIDNIFDNIFIINFNYDRCLEHFLTHALARFFNLPITQTYEVVQRLWIKRPYGMVAEYVPPRTSGIQFGHSVDTNIILNCFENIKTFSEDEPDQEMISEIREMLDDAQKVVFLGLAFHDANVEFFSLKDEGVPSTALDHHKGPQLYATAHGQSKEDANAIAHQLFYRLLSHKRNDIEAINSHMHIREDLKCAELLSAYRKSI